jgi:hypothetical protein
MLPVRLRTRFALIALGSGFSLVCLVCAAAALAAALLTLIGLHGHKESQPSPEALHDPAHPELEFPEL